MSFSGGRDSSAVLALATDVARRHGLPDPVPVIMRFAGAPETDERSWQELVLEHLGLRPEVLSLRGELDALGAIATATLRRDGLRWPANAYMHVPVLEAARGGALLTGAGGDELFATRGAPHVLLVRGRLRPRPPALRSALGSALPRRAREARRRRLAPNLRWLTPAGNRVLARALAREETTWPSRWDRSVRHWYRGRAFSALGATLAADAAETAVALVNPLLDPQVLAALAAAGGATGFSSREAAMHAVLGGLLPDAVMARPTKAEFSTPFWGPAMRGFAAGWDGAGVDPELVDTDALRREWAAAQPDFRTALLLHSAWLAGQASASSS